MSSITDLADLIAAHRARLERAFDGEIARLRVEHGNRAVDGSAADRPAGAAAGCELAGISVGVTQ